LADRAEPNLLRTGANLEAFGPIEMQAIGRRRIPIVKLERLRVEIDPYAMADRIEGQANANLHPA
jgi:predicted transcriptional regulator